MKALRSLLTIALIMLVTIKLLQAWRLNKAQEASDDSETTFQAYDEIAVDTKQGPSTQEPLIAPAPFQRVERKHPIAASSTSLPGDPQDYAPVDEAGRLILTQVMLDGDKVIAHGDVMIGQVQELKAYLQGEHSIALSVPKKWEGSTIAYDIDPALPNPERVQSALARFNELKLFKFVKRGQEADYMHFTVGEQHCYSYLGKQGGKQNISLSGGCQEGEIVHEIMHALGFLHEQNRMDRDEHILIHWHNIAEEHHLQFKILPDSYNLSLNTPFDFQSIMLYSPESFSQNEDPAITKRDGSLYNNAGKRMSAGDRLRLKRLFERCKDQCGTW